MLFVGCLEYFCIILWILVAGYGANLQKAFGRDDDHKWPRYLKTHDYHRLLQHEMGMLKGVICIGDSKNEGNSSRGGTQVGKGLPSITFLLLSALLVHLVD
jgi:hypothetical protein